MRHSARYTNLRFPLLFCVFLLVTSNVSACCGGGNDPFHADGDSETDAVDTETDDAGGGHLTNRHSGWKNPYCLACHGGETADDPHVEANYRPPDCGKCHGYNGAIHVDHAGDPNADCAECHRQGAVVCNHLQGFDIPADCTKCHLHPEDLNGE